MMTPENVKKMYQLLARHCHASALPDIDRVLGEMKNGRYGMCSVVVVPTLADGGSYRQLIENLHLDVAKEPLVIEGISDDLFMTTAVGARFTAAENNWRRQSVYLETFPKKSPLGLFASVLYLLELVMRPGLDTVAHAMWSGTISNQAGIQLPDKGIAYVRSHSTNVGQRNIFKQLVVSSVLCRDSLAPFYLHDFVV